MKRRAKLVLASNERSELESVIARQGAKPAHVRRARVILMSSEGVRNVDIAQCLSLSVGQVSRIRYRHVAQALSHP